MLFVQMLHDCSLSCNTFKEKEKEGKEVHLTLTYKVHTSSKPLAPVVTRVVTNFSVFEEN